MWSIITQVAQSLHTSIEYLMLILLFGGALIFFAVNFQKGLLAILILSAGMFTWFYQTGLNYSIPLIVMLMTVVMMSLSIYVTNKTKQAVY